MAPREPRPRLRARDRCAADVVDGTARAPERSAEARELLGELVAKSGGVPQAVPGRDFKGSPPGAAGADCSTGQALLRRPGARPWCGCRPIRSPASATGSRRSTADRRIPARPASTAARPLLHRQRLERSAAQRYRSTFDGSEVLPRRHRVGDRQGRLPGGGISRDGLVPPSPTHRRRCRRTKRPRSPTSSGCGRSKYGDAPIDGRRSSCTGTEHRGQSSFTVTAGSAAGCTALLPRSVRASSSPSASTVDVAAARAIARWSHRRCRRLLSAPSTRSVPATVAAHRPCWHRVLLRQRTSASATSRAPAAGPATRSYLASRRRRCGAAGRGRARGRLLPPRLAGPATNLAVQRPERRRPRRVATDAQCARGSAARRRRRIARSRVQQVRRRRSCRRCA